MTEPTPTAELRNGATEATAFVAWAMGTLESLLERQPGAFMELVLICYDTTHEFLGGGSRERIEATGLLECGQDVPDLTVRNIVISATNRDGADIRLVDPIKRTTEVK